MVGPWWTEKLHSESKFILLHYNMFTKYPHSQQDQLWKIHTEVPIALLRLNLGAMLIYSATGTIGDD